MKRRSFCRAASAALGLALLLGSCGSSEPLPPADSLSLWYVSDSILSEELSALAIEYAASGAAAVKLRPFESEGDLLTALQETKPDLLLCRHDLAQALLREERLSLPDYGDKAVPDLSSAFLSSLYELQGRFVPLGASVPLLAVRTDLCPTNPASFSSLSALCGAASSWGRQEPLFLSSDSFSLLFFSFLAQQDEVFHASKDLDANRDTYRRLYNQLAHAAFDGGLDPTEASPAVLLSEGGLVCGLCLSESFGEELRAGLSFAPLPVTDDGKVLTGAYAYGLAVTAQTAEGQTAAGAFLSWLCQAQRLRPVALRAGLLPSVNGLWAKDDPFELALSRTEEQYKLVFPACDSDFLRNEGAFEQEFCSALALLG